MYEERPSSSPHIKFVWRARVQKSGSFKDIAHGFWVLVIRTSPAKTQVVLTGPVMRARTITYEAGQVNWGIVFQPHVFITALPKKEMLNTSSELPLVDPNTFLVGKEKIPIPDYESAEAFVDELIERDIISANPVVAQALAATPPAMSARHLQRHYAQAAGLSQTHLQQIERARKAFVLLEEGKPIAAAAFEAGYADQAHMTRSLKLLAGQTPAQIIASYRTQNNVASVQ